jgi:hypothetical protein
LYILSGLSSGTFNCIIVRTPLMLIHFQLAVMALNGSSEEKGKATASA